MPGLSCEPGGMHHDTEMLVVGECRVTVAGWLGSGDLKGEFS